MQSDLYEKHRRTFADTSAFVIVALRNQAPDRVATIAFRHPPGSETVQCFLHVIGLPMVRASATGGGYDRESAALASAAMLAAAGSFDPLLPHEHAMCPRVERLLNLLLKTAGRKVAFVPKPQFESVPANNSEWHYIVRRDAEFSVFQAV